MENASKMEKKKTVNNGIYAKTVKKVNKQYTNSTPIRQHLNNNIIALTKEGVGIRGTARLLCISPTTLINRIKKIASEIKEPVLSKGKTYEVDELRTFIKKKKT